MKVTKENIKSVYPKISNLLNDVEKETYNEIDDLLFMYEEDENCKQSVDWLVEKFQEKLNSIEEKPKEEKKKEPYEAPAIEVREIAKENIKESDRIVKVGKTKEGHFYVMSPYNEDFVKKARFLGGKWGTVNGKNAWLFDISEKEEVKEILRKIYGDDGEGAAPELVTLLVKNYSDDEYRGPVVLFGRTIARAYGRDSGAKLGDDIVLLEGSINSGGSVKNWRTIVYNATLKIKNFPVTMLENEYVKKAIETGWVEVQGMKTKKEPYEAPTIEVRDEEKKAKAKTKKVADDVQEVETVLLEKVIMASFANLFNPKSRAKTSVKERAVALLKKLQKAIIEKKIRKTSSFASEIVKVQSVLVDFCNGKEKDIKKLIDEKEVERIGQIGKSEKQSTSVKLMKKVIDLQSNPMKTTAKALLDMLNSAIEADIVNAELKEYVKPLTDYSAGKTKELKMNEKALRGLRGLRGLGNIEDDDIQDTGIMSSEDLLQKQFVVMNLGPVWGEFLGRPKVNFKAMFYGLPGNGKSTFALKFAGHLAKNLNRKVLYVSSEEGCNYTLRDKVIRMNVASPNLFIAENLNCDLSQYDVIFIDSVNDMGLTTADLKALPSDKAYVYIFQTTKSGEFRGNQQFMHDVDTVVKVHQMRATTDKNRFGVGGKEMEV